MSPHRVTIAGMMGVVLVCAIGFAALRSHTELWVQMTTSGVISVLLVATVGAMKGRERTFWLGFAVWGWAYAILSLGPWSSIEIRPVLLTTRILDELAERLPRDSAGPPGAPAPPERMPQFGGLAEVTRGPSEVLRIHWIGHALFCLPHGLAGGTLACVFARRASGT